MPGLFGPLIGYKITVTWLLELTTRKGASVFFPG